jgi:5-methylcytosine-specific restriction endonuclease McrA
MPASADAEQAFLDERQSLWWRKYTDYLKSPRWRVIRGVVLSRDKGICQACLREKATEVHHLTYVHIFNEPLFDLVSVCEDCHAKITHLDRCARDGYQYERTVDEW